MHNQLTCLNQLPIFHEIDDQIKEQILPIFHHLKHYQKGNIIDQPNDDNPKLIAVDEGLAKVCQFNQEGDEQIIHILKAGDIYNQQALFTEYKNEQNFLVAMTDITACSINHQAFQELIKSQPELSFSLLNSLGSKIVELERQYANRSILSVEDRILEYLRNEAIQQEATTFKLSLPKKEIAKLLGTTPETFSRKLALLEKEKKIKREKSNISLL